MYSQFVIVPLMKVNFSSILNILFVLSGFISFVYNNDSFIFIPMCIRQQKKKLICVIFLMEKISQTLRQYRCFF